MFLNGNHNQLHSTIATVSYNKWLANSILPIKAKFKEARNDPMAPLEAAGQGSLFQTKILVQLGLTKEIINNHSLIIFKTRLFTMLL
jgi:hypothetical protein